MLLKKDIFLNDGSKQLQFEKNFVIIKISRKYFGIFWKVFTFFYLFNIIRIKIGVKILDAIDYEILACLRENSRENATNIGSKINLSTSAVIERIKKLESSGVIKQYTVLIDQNILGRDLNAFITVRLEHPKYYENFVTRVKENAYITECYYVAGDFDFILKVVIEKRKNLEEILNYIKSINGVSFTRTSVVLSENKNEVCILPDKHHF